MSSTANIAGIKVGEGQPVRILGIINVSPESFYKESVQNKKTIQRAARAIEEEGADALDIGAMSTAPYLETDVSEKEEAERLEWAVKAVRAVVKIPISVDTSRPLPAKAGLNAGADILNDITGLSGDTGMYAAARMAKGMILMAHPTRLNGDSASPPALTVKRLLSEALKQAQEAGVNPGAILIDPGIGFFRNTHLDWWKWDLAVLRDLEEIAALPAPVLVGVSRKSFISQILEGRTPEHRLYGSLAATAASVLNGAAMVRTHDVGATKEAVQVAQSILLERVSFRVPAPVERAVKGRKKSKS